MPFYNSGDPGSKNRWRHNVARAMSERAERTRCPKCGRGNALSEYYDRDTGVHERWCRFGQAKNGPCTYYTQFRLWPKDEEFGWCRWKAEKVAKA